MKRSNSSVAEGSVPTWVASYPPHGQGIFSFNVIRSAPFSIILRSIGSTRRVCLEIEHSRVQFKLASHGEDVQLLAEVHNEGVGYNKQDTSYWFSLNRNSLVMKYGKGYFMEETTLLTYDFLAGLTADEKMKKRYDMKDLFGPECQKLLELHDFLREEGPAIEVKWLPNYYSQHQVHTQKDKDDINNKVEFYPIPLTVNCPFLIKDSSEISLFELDRNDYTFTACLPPECQELYSNITSSRMELDWVPAHQKYKLSDAIRYSFENKGKALREKLRHKKMKYIRVTVGPHRSWSPGIPYVLELWPKSQGSPVHCHGNSYGVIKVLYGELQIKIYNKDMKTMVKEYHVKKGDVTWMTPHWYQSHQLFNDSDDFSATIQCYRYGSADTKMRPYFDYVNDDGSLGEFLPNCDFTFTELNQIVLDEYSKHISD